MLLERQAQQVPPDAPVQREPQATLDLLARSAQDQPELPEQLERQVQQGEQDLLVHSEPVRLAQLELLEQQVPRGVRDPRVLLVSLGRLGSASPEAPDPPEERDPPVPPAPLVQGSYRFRVNDLSTETRRRRRTTARSLSRILRSLSSSLRAPTSA